MKITAVFESWHIDDGNYPALRRDQLVNLSFEMQLDLLTPTHAEFSDKFEHVSDAEYSFIGSILRRYDRDDNPLFVIQANGFRFYTTGVSSGYEYLIPGTRVSGVGTLLLDHYLWVEFLKNYQDPPDLFYTLRIESIRKVQIPERFISRNPTGSTSWPTSLKPDDYSGGFVTEIETMEGQSFSETFYLLDFVSAAGQVPRTFLG